MLYAKIENGAVAQYPYSFSNLRKDNPNTSFPKTSMADESIRSDYGVVEVISLGIPQSETHNSSEGDPELINGSWTQVWNQTPKQQKNWISKHRLIGLLSTELLRCNLNLLRSRAWKHGKPMLLI